MNAVPDHIVKDVISGKVGFPFRSSSVPGLISVPVGHHRVILYGGRAYYENPYHSSWHASVCTDSAGNPLVHSDAAEFPQEVYFHVANQVIAGGW